MHGKRRRRSPLHQNEPVIDPTKGDLDTSFVDKIYTKTKVDEELRKSGHYSEGPARGKKKTTEHYTGQVVASGGGSKVFLGELND